MVTLNVKSGKSLTVTVECCQQRLHWLAVLFKMMSEVVYHFQKVSGNFGWKVNGTRLFGSFEWKISGNNGTSEKVVSPVFPDGMFQGKFTFHFIKPHL